VRPRKRKRLVFGEHAGNRSHGHVHVVGAGALCECVQLLVNIEFILFGQGWGADPIPAWTMTGCTCGDAAFRIASINEPLN
jgi:hypothetical protein